MDIRSRRKLCGIRTALKHTRILFTIINIFKVNCISRTHANSAQQSFAHPLSLTLSHLAEVLVMVFVLNWII